MAIIYPSMPLQLRPSVYVRPCNVHMISDGILYTLHTVAAPVVQVSVKTELSYQNNMIIAFFLPLLFDEKQHILFKIRQVLYPIWRHSTNSLTCQTLETHFWCQFRSLETQNVHIFHCLQSGFVRVLENLESPGILLWHFPGLESPGKRLLVLESSGNLFNSSKKYEMYGRQ